MRSATLPASLFLLAWAAVAPATDRPSTSQTVSIAGSATSNTASDHGPAP
jgi:hypothetical protein